MSSDDFAQRVADVAVLVEPVRRALYAYVVAQPDAVGRDQAAAGVGVARHTAKFHLDRLVEQGLLDTDYKRLGGRGGPGAGRPSKVYRRSAREVSVTVPERHYDLAGHLLAQAIEDSGRDGTSAHSALQRAATEFGQRLGEETRQRAGARPDRQTLVAATCATLAAQGYEPRSKDGTVTLANCPFHTLARDHVALVCGMNLALLQELARRSGDGELHARLDPGPDRCCVTLTAS